jgi:hypothetical protein
MPNLTCPRSISKTVTEIFPGPSISIDSPTFRVSTNMLTPFRVQILRGKTRPGPGGRWIGKTANRGQAQSDAGVDSESSRSSEDRETDPRLGGYYISPP